MAKIPKYFYFRVTVGLKEITLEDASDVDVVEVTRCPFCVHSEQEGDEEGSEYLCLYYGDQWNGPDHFCSHGIPERRTAYEQSRFNFHPPEMV